MGNLATFVSRVASFSSAVGADVKELRTRVGTLANLTTINKTNIVSAVNELDAEVSALSTNLTTNYIPLSQKGVANGVATLDVAGKVPAGQLPSYVDDVIEVANYAALPVTGETGKIYVLITPYTSGGVTTSQFRWSGTVYVAIVSSPGTTDAVTEGSANLYFTEARVRGTVLTGLSLASATVIAATDSVLSAFGKLQKQISDNLTTLTTHTSNTSNPHSVTKTQVGLGSVENYGIATQAEAEAGASSVKYMTPLRTANYVNIETGTGNPFTLYTDARDAV